MKEARRGIEEGLASAKNTLGAIGALEFDEVSSGIDKTMTLLEEKLKGFGQSFKDSGTASEQTSEEVA